MTFPVLVLIILGVLLAAGIILAGVGALLRIASPAFRQGWDAEAAHQKAAKR